MILSTGDRATYYPAVPADAVTNNLLSRAQALAETIHGAARKLDVADYSETYDYSAHGYKLHYQPIVADSVEVSKQDPYSLMWTVLDADAWVLEGNWLRVIQGLCPEYRIKVDYQSGFDNDSANIADVKLELGQVVEYLYSPSGSATTSGIEEFSVDGEYSAKYSQQNLVMGVPLRLLVPFRKYLPVQRF